MKIDSSKWISTLPLSKVTNKDNKDNYKMDADRWVNTIPKKKNNNV